MKICYSSNGFKEHSLLEIFTTLSKIGYQGLELSLNHIHFPQLLLHFQVDDIRRYSKKFQLPITNIHIGEPRLIANRDHYPSLITKNEADRNKKLNLIKKAFNLALQINCPYVTITSGLKSEALKNPTESTNLLHASLQTLVEATPPGVILLMEQEPEMLIANTTDIKNLLNTYQNKIKINLDIGHLKVNNENIVESIKTLKDHIVNIHFEDIKGNTHAHLIPGQGDLPFKEVFACLKEINYQGNLTADLYPFSNQAALTAQTTFDFVKNNLQ